jgi:hypothetical protein
MGLLGEMVPASPCTTDDDNEDWLAGWLAGWRIGICQTEPKKSSAHRRLVLFPNRNPTFNIPPTQNGTRVFLSTATTTQQRTLSLSLAIQSYIYIYIQAVFGGNDDGVVDDKVVSTER